MITSPAPRYKFAGVLLDDDDRALMLSDDLTALHYRLELNKPGISIVTVRDGHPLLDHLVENRIFQVFLYYNVGIFTEPFRDFVGLYRDRQRTTDQDGNIYHLLYFPGINEILSRNIVAWPSGVANRSRWGNQQAAIIANDVVRYNCTSQATTANGRIRDASPVKGITIGAPATTPQIDYTAPGRPVLEVLNELAAAGGFDFELYKGDYTGVGNPPVYTFMTGAGLLPTAEDMSGDVIFDLALDNVRAGAAGGDRQRERTVAVVAGQGEGSGRAFVVRTGANHSSANDYEVFVDARDLSETGELESRGDAQLAELRAKDFLSVEIIPSRGYPYRPLTIVNTVSYALGYLVTVQFGGAAVTKKISAVDVEFTQTQRPNIRLELTDV